MSTDGYALLIRHSGDPPDDRVVSWFETAGIPHRIIRPYRGETDALNQAGSVVASVIYGGPFGIDRIGDHPFLADEARWIETCLHRGIPLLGICQGAQQIAHVLGATVGPRPDEFTEFGYYDVHATHEGRDLFPERLKVCQNHFHGFSLAGDMVRLAGSEAFPNQAFRAGDRVYGFQFHAEVTPDGFRRWQDAPWARFDAPGAQGRAEQNRAQALAEPQQGAWFDRAMSTIFGKVSL